MPIVVQAIPSLWAWLLRIPPIVSLPPLAHLFIVFALCGAFAMKRGARSMPHTLPNTAAARNGHRYTPGGVDGHEQRTTDNSECTVCVMVGDIPAVIHVGSMIHIQ